MIADDPNETPEKDKKKKKNDDKIEVRTITIKPAKNALPHYDQRGNAVSFESSNILFNN